MAYDIGRGRMVVFSGTDDVELFADLWEYNGVEWVQRSPPSRCRGAS